MKSISLWKDIGSKEAYSKNVGYFATPSLVLHYFFLHLAVQKFIWFPTVGQFKWQAFKFTFKNYKVDSTYNSFRL